MPTRQRPERTLRMLEFYRAYAGAPVRIEVVLDEDDRSMLNQPVLNRLAALKCRVSTGAHRSKVEACNDFRSWRWDVLLLASDDMLPVFEGYAPEIERDMLEHFPDLDGALHYNDGNMGEALCTFPVLGRKLYEHFGYVYYPGYQGLYCDREMTEVLQSVGRLPYIDKCLFRHDHYTIGHCADDALYERDRAFAEADGKLYEERKARNFDCPSGLRPEKLP